MGSVLIRSDNGEVFVNLSAVVTLDLTTKPEGHMLVAFGPNVTTILAAGSKERCMAALAAIGDAVADGHAVLDLRDVIGQRPDLQVAQQLPAQVPGQGRMA
jgi:hypothetical protein